MEKVSERRREPEPEETAYDQQRRIDNEKVAKKAHGKVIIKGKDIGWEQGKQGLIKFFMWEKNWNEVGAPGWRLFINHIKKHSGKHIHQGGLAIYVLEGKGYTVVDGTRYDWEEGDLILLPVKPGGCEHQHFNLDPDGNAYWMAFIYVPMQDQAGVEFIQVADHPDWISSKTKP